MGGLPLGLALAPGVGVSRASFPMLTTRRWVLPLLACLGAALWLGLVSWRLGSVPGMSLDEAWSILSARGQWDAVNPLSGMTQYAGPFPVLLLRLFGDQHGLLVLRGASVVANGATLVLLGALLRQVYPERAHAAWALPLIATSPVWLIVLRTGIEVLIFTPLLLVLGLFLMLRRTPGSAFLGGLLWGLLVYNHLLGVCFPAGILLAFWMVYRRLPSIPLGAALLGTLVGVAPRLIALAFFSQPLEGSAARWSLLEAFGDLRWLPLCLWQTLQGNTVYLRYVGRLAVVPWPYWLLALGFVVPWLRRPSSLPKVAVFALAATLNGAVLATLVAPYLAVRFLVIPSIGLTFFLALAGAASIEQNARFRWPVVAAALALSGCNLFYAVQNFYRPWQRDELGLTQFFLGDRSKRTNNWAYFPKEALVRELAKLEPLPEQIITVPTLERPLRVLLAGQPVRVTLAITADHALRSVFVDYLWPDSPARHCAGTPTGELCFGSASAIARYFIIYRDRQ
jgi:hypothetical protein